MTEDYQPLPPAGGAPPLPAPPRAEDARPPPSPPPPKKPGVDPEARKEWLGALRAVQDIKPPEELPPLRRAWVQMYCTALRGGDMGVKLAAEAADYGVMRLTENSDAAQLTRLPLPDYTEMLKLISDVMEEHPGWERYIRHTPLENDLPVRAANVVMERLRK